MSRTLLDLLFHCTYIFPSGGELGSDDPFLPEEREDDEGSVGAAAAGSKSTAAAGGGGNGGGGATMQHHVSFAPQMQENGEGEESIVVEGERGSFVPAVRSRCGARLLRCALGAVRALGAMCSGTCSARYVRCAVGDMLR